MFVVGGSSLIFLMPHDRLALLFCRRCLYPHKKQIERYGDKDHQREEGVDFRGDLTPCHAVDFDGQCGIACAGHEVTDDHIIQREGDR